MQSLAILNPRITELLAMVAVGIMLLVTVLLMMVYGLAGVLKEVFDPEPQEEDSQSGSDCC